MPFYPEKDILTFTTVSSQEKPSLANGKKPLNGSRLRELDTGKTYYYATATDTWYETEGHIKAIAGDSPMVDTRSLDLLEQILTTLRKIEYHLFLGTDTELKDQDVGG